ncbi:MAG: phosphodiester glycosidase family protein [Beijerinckiaceae bacterium]
MKKICRTAIWLFGIVLCLFQAAVASAAPCEPLSDGVARYVVCTFDVTKVRLRLFWADADGKPYGTFAALAEALKNRNERLSFAMNAGMFQPDFRPVGLYIEAGHEITKANTRAGPGNFHLKPNGVFYFDVHHAGVTETSAFLRSGQRPDYATQSGPLLVQGGVLHPKIEPSGTSEKIRNGVGVRDGHIVVFAISDEPVTFYRFASLFRDRLACPDALFLDGSISSLFAPALGRADGLLPFGPIVAVVEQIR